MFRAARNVWLKSVGAALVERLLSENTVGRSLGFDLGKISNQLVDDAWNEAPQLFDGTYGQRPSRIAVAAWALANGVLRNQQNQLLQELYGLCLNSILTELELRGNRYPLNGLDRELLEMSERALPEYFSDRTIAVSQQEAEFRTSRRRGDQ